MSTTTRDENRAVAEEFFERINDHDLSVIDELCADDFAVEISRKGTEESVVGKDGLRSIFEEYFAAFPDWQYHLDEVLVDGDRVAVFSTDTGTHDGEFRGVSPTGNEIEVESAGMVRVQEGEIVDLRPHPNMLGLFEQIGVNLDL